MIKKVRHVLIGALLCGVITGCSTVASTSVTSNNGYETYINPGQAFKHTSFTNIDNKNISLDPNKKKLVLLFATWCSDSLRTLNELKASSIIRDPTVQIIAIGREQTRETLKEFNQSFALPFQLVADSDRTIYQQYANKGIPRLILLDNNNTVVKTLIGEQANIVDQVIW
ncbi:redoxin domain protein [Pseudoalteromonas sp. MSK9-3]|uniref:TlpA family protein disulfide reductase n=1 Tax=Pseudoalteromonas sp. MSK9-3 TaxID=1897633 RepID=UPI000E6BA704|nr:TlpA family protein disulfide reductase [Pseudoalteromonas sp. MSK9-3]RJE77376.1 redoxin domain protein [Pseudoalteromonas sp. MSK9-3]